MPEITEQNKLFDTTEYVSAMKALVEEGHEVSMTVFGSSMTPFLGDHRDRIFFSAPDSPLRPGDMVFYQRRSGQFVMHRIYRIRNGVYDILGDAQTQIERGITREQIFARVIKVERKGKILTPKNFLWRMFSGPWRWFYPLRPIVRRLYGIIRFRK